MSPGPAFLRTAHQRCLLDLAYLRSVQRNASSVTQVVRDSDPQKNYRRQRINSQLQKDTISDTNSATSKDLLVSEEHQVVPEPEEGSFTLFRGIMARAGINLPIGLGNHYKPDPFLRHQITTENQDEVLTATMTPLVQLSYEDQLRFKWERNKQLLRNFSRTISKNIPQIHLDKDGLICPLDPVIPSPVLYKFRNKDELNVSVGVDGYPKRVGFFVGRSRDSNIICVRPTALTNMKDSHKHLGQRFEEFIESSQYDGCRLEPKGFVGHWKGIIVRSNRKGDLMGIVTMHPQSLTVEELSAEKERLKEFFLTGSGKDCNLKSLYFQACPHSFCSPLMFPHELLFGEEHIIETINDMKFRISPSAFFQLNPDAAEVMYQKIAELIQPNRESVLLDVCCGTGTIGLSLASKFDKVIGVEKDLLAVTDADCNMGLNNVQNATFYCGSAEKAIPRLLKTKEFNYSTVSAVVNPGRGGLDVNVIHALRKTPQVDRVVYVSCMPVQNAMRNLIDLCLPTKTSLPGEPFYPTRAVPVDMFPHTDHCELLILFERNRLFSI